MLKKRNKYIFLSWLDFNIYTFITTDIFTPKPGRPGMFCFVFMYFFFLWILDGVITSKKLLMDQPNDDVNILRYRW